MKRICTITLIATLLAGCTSNAERVAKGVVFDATMNTIAIVDDSTSDTLYVSTVDALITSPQGILIGDTAQIRYKVLEGNNFASSVTITPAITVVGSWCEPIPSMSGIQGVTLNASGVATSINMSTLQYDTWAQNGDTLILTGKSIGNGQTIDFTRKAVITKLTADSLILVEGDMKIRYSRQQ